jgi:hypothetical protein
MIDRMIINLCAGGALIVMEKVHSQTKQGYLPPPGDVTKVIACRKFLDVVLPKE